MDVLSLLQKKAVKRIPYDIFVQIEKYMPFSSVDIIVLFENNKILLTKRSIRPYKGYWHLPGSIILKRETMIEAAKRSAREELGIKLDNIEFVGNYELFTKTRHYITHAYSARYQSGKIELDSSSSEYVIAEIDNLPKPIIPIQKQMIRDFIKFKKSS